MVTEVPLRRDGELQYFIIPKPELRVHQEQFESHIFGRKLEQIIPILMLNEEIKVRG